MSKRLADICRFHDPTRPTVSACNDPGGADRTGFAKPLGVFGINYSIGAYQQYKGRYTLVASETASALSTRGEYNLVPDREGKLRIRNEDHHQVTSYDLGAPPWGYTAETGLLAMARWPWVAGEFVWTGFDYIGEPTPFYEGRNADGSTDWPVRSSYFGFVDLAGFPKDRYYLYQSEWTKTPMVHVLPHWNWAGHEGQPIPVMVYTNADEVELFLNGQSLGRKKRFSEPVALPAGRNVTNGVGRADPDAVQAGKFLSKWRLEWQVPYAPGSLTALAYRGGKQVAVDQRKTAGAPARIELIPDRSVIAADGDDLSFLTVRIEDKDRNLCPMADSLVRFSVTGAGKIEAVDNGNAATEEPFHADHRKAFNGLALLIVRSIPGAAGAIHVTAASDGLAQAAAELTARK